MNLVLIGYRGTGKTTVARLTADRLRWPWYDADAEIEARAGKSIARIFAEDGEAVFRDMESQVVADLTTRQRCVLALGGGAVLRPENREAILRNGRVVLLKASPRTLLERIQNDNSTRDSRPDLTAQGGINEIITTLASRERAYADCAHYEFNTEELTPHQVVDAILAKVRLE